MAEKTAVFSLKVDTGKSVQELEKLTSELNQVNGATDQVNQSTKDVNATFEQVYGELQPLTTRMGEAEDRLYELALAGQQASQEYKDLLATVANYRKTQIETDLVVDQASSTMSQKLVGAVELGAGVFQGAQSAVALFGVENEKLTETMVRLQAVQGVVSSVMIIQEQLRQKNIISTTIMNGLEKAKNFILTGSIAPALANVAATQAQGAANVGLATATGSATTAMKLFRLALIATGIGAIVVGIGLLIANFDKVSAAVRGAINWFNKLGPAMKVVIGTLTLGLLPAISAITKALEYFGVVDDAQTAKMKANARAKTDATEKEMNKKISAEKRKAQAVDENLSFEIRKAQAAGKNTEEMEEKKLQAALKSGRAILQMQREKIAAYEAEIKLLKATGDADSDRAKKLQKSLNETKKNASEQYKENKKNAQDLEVLRIEQDKKDDDAAKDRAAKAKERADKRAEAARKEAERLAEIERKANEDRIKAEDDQFELSLQLMKEGQEKELFELSIAYDKKYELAHGNAQLEYQLRVQEQTDRIAIINKYNQMELDKIAEQEAKKKALRDQVIRFINDDRENELLDLEEWYKKQEDVNLDAFKNGAIDEEEFYDAGLKAQEEYRKKKAEIDKKYSDIAKEEAGKERAEIIANIQEALETAQKYFDEIKKVNEVINELDQVRLDRIASNREADLANLDENLKAQLQQEGLTADQKAQIEQNFAQQKYNIELKAYQEEEKIKKAQFMRDKAIKIGQIAMDTASGVMKSVAASPLTFGLPWSAFTAALGIAQAAIVGAQQYKAGQPPSAPNLNAGAGGAAGAASSEFTANTNAQTTDLTQLGQGGQMGQGQTSTTQVVVLESDITNTQNKVQLQEAKSSF